MWSSKLSDDHLLENRLELRSIGSGSEFKNETQDWDDIGITKNNVSGYRLKIILFSVTAA
jgi:hypothetical protein